MPLFFDEGSGDTNLFFFPVLILSLLQDALGTSVVFSKEDNFSLSKPLGFKWNNEPNDHEDGKIKK